jgi:hypothetical protein
VQAHRGYERDLSSDDGHQCVEPAELAGCIDDESVHIRARPHVTDERNRAGARLSQLMNGITRSVRTDVGDGDSCASRSERTRDRASDAFASAPITKVLMPSSGLAKSFMAGSFHTTGARWPC